MQITHRYPIYVAALACIFVGVFPSLARATYTQPYYESYYESYYQTYYQSYYQTYYQPSYQTTFTTDVTIGTSSASSLAITGSLSKGSGTFVIDHPLDPKNKLLFHSFVESPDVKNLYDGIAHLDEKGEVTITLPTYFLALNEHFNYLVTPVGSPMPNLYVSSPVRKRFWFFGPAQVAFSGGTPFGKISWQVTGIRHDTYIRAHPVVVEVDKGPEQPALKGEYLFEGYNTQ